MQKLRKIVAGIGSVAMLLGVVPQVLAGSVFSDVADTNEFAPFIHDLQSQGIVSGVGTTGMYMPLRNVSRGEMMKMVVNAMKKSVAGRTALEAAVNVPMLAGAPHFDDVQNGSSFYEQVELGYALGIVNGRRAPSEGQQGTFGVNEPVLRQEAMKMIVGAYRKVAGETFMRDLTGGPSFDDVSATSEFYDFIQTAYNLGMVNGYGNSKFGPMDPMRRDQMAKVISNAMRVFTTGKPLSVGVPASVQVDSSDPRIKNDGSSTSTITCTIVDRNGNRVGDWTTPLMFTTDAGTLRIVGGSEAASASKSVSADRGRGQITLIASTIAATATVTCKSGTLQGTTQVVFSADAPGVRNGFGSAQIAGVGELQVRATDDHIVASAEDVPSGAESAGTINATPINGFATIESFVYDDSGDPTCGDRLIYSIQSGNGNLQLAVPTVPASTAVRSLILDGTSATCLNGRYVAHLNLLSTQTAGDIVVKVTDTSTSPSLMTTVTIRVDVVRLEANVYDTNILTRNSVQVADDEATASNVAPVLIKTLDENNEPFLTVDRSSEGRDALAEDDLECRIVSGATAGARLEGTIAGGSSTTLIRSATVSARYVAGTAGLYVLNVVAGTASGTLNVECRDVDAITQPAVQFSVNVRNPEVEMFVSSREAREGTLSTIMARVRDGSKPVTGEQIRLQIGGGDGSVDSIAGTGYVRSEASNNSVNMDHICFDVAPVGTSSPNNLFLGYGDVTIREFDDPCGTGETDSGWYTAKLFMPESTERDQTIALTATDLSRVEQPRDEANVIVTSANIGDAQTMEVMPISDEVGVNQDIGTVIFVQDDSGYGLHCSALGTPFGNANGEGSTSGCLTASRNGYAETDIGDTISINRSLPATTGADAGTSGALSVSPINSENVNIYSRGTGTVTGETTNHWIVHNLGGGAYFMAVRAKDRADRGEWDLDLNDASGDQLDSQLVQLNIVPNSVDAEFNLETTMPDWNNTLVVFVSDQNDDPVTTLAHCNTTPVSSNFGDFALTNAGAEIAAVQAYDTGAGSLFCPESDTSLLSVGDVTGVVGTGLYVFNFDTLPNVAVGTVTANISLNQATNPDTSASYRIVDPTVTVDAWPTHMGTSNIVPLTVIVRDDNGDPMTFLTGTPVQVEITNGSGQLAATNAATVTGSLLRVNLTNTTNGVFAGAFKASSVRGNVDLVARINAISNRAEDSLTLSVH
ncbi:S-layer homology domain-containing protein [Candidatus Gracilibacteria bacterium]|nr:S-layer homology domain-containing protein [Candidatus Gracilibacteria bacterium]